jgi:probable selenium-dependent hydroxylase accessory protein YqeC
MLVAALALERARLIALCGAGGKSTLMRVLAGELVAAGERVLITTTTRIAREEAEGSWPVLAAAGAAEILAQAADRFRVGAQQGGAVIAHRPSEDPANPGRKLAGLPPGELDAVFDGDGFDRMLVEADGSARRSLKAPAAHEPVFPGRTDALVMVAGLNGLGRPLDDAHLFRPEIWAALTGARLGDPVTPEDLAEVVRHPDGLARGAPADAARRVFLNRADDEPGCAAAERVVDALRRDRGRTPLRVVSGWLLPSPGTASIVDLP